MHVDENGGDNGNRQIDIGVLKPVYSDNFPNAIAHDGHDLTHQLSLGRESFSVSQGLVPSIPSMTGDSVCEESPTKETRND